MEQVSWKGPVLSSRRSPPPRPPSHLPAGLLWLMCRPSRRQGHPPICPAGNLGTARDHGAAPPRRPLQAAGEHLGRPWEAGSGGRHPRGGCRAGARDKGLRALSSEGFGQGARALRRWCGRGRGVAKARWSLADQGALQRTGQTSGRRGGGDTRCRAKGMGC